MVIALLEGGTRPVLMLGLTEENVKRLKLGQPIHVTRDKHGEAIPDSMDLAILYGKDSDELMNLLRSAGSVRPFSKAENESSEPIS